MKRIFSILLALLLGLGLLVPINAKIDPYSPIITKAPQCLYLAKTGDILTLEIEAECQEGYEGELSCIWHISSDGTWNTIILETSGEKLELKITDDMYQHFFGSSNLFIAVSALNTYIDPSGKMDHCPVTLGIDVVVYRFELEKPFLLLWYYIKTVPTRIQNWWEARRYTI